MVPNYTVMPFSVAALSIEGFILPLTPETPRPLTYYVVASTDLKNSVHFTIEIGMWRKHCGMQNLYFESENNVYR